MNDEKNIFRLRKKHGSGVQKGVSSADGKRLVEGQSIRNAIVGGLVVVLVFSMFWVTLTELTNRIFPWFTVILGVLLGTGIRLTGRGVDWRFPLIAAVLAVVGSLAANIIVAASVTAESFGTGTLEVLSAVTSMTWPVFINEALSVADAFYAVIGAMLAAFYANRRLTRTDYHALRLWREEQQDG